MGNEMLSRFSFLFLVIAALLTLGWAARLMHPGSSWRGDEALAQVTEVELGNFGDLAEIADTEFFPTDETPQYLVGTEPEGAEAGYPIEIAGKDSGGGRNPAGADLVVEPIWEPMAEIPEASLGDRQSERRL